MAGEYIEFNNSTQPAINDTNLNRLQQLIKQDIQGAVSGDTLPVGAIIHFGSDTIPENWLLCDGSAVSRTTYQQLFNTIGTSFGQGDGFTTFNLPDLRERVGVGKSSDTEFDTLGKTGGSKDLQEHYHKSIRWASPTGRKFVYTYQSGSADAFDLADPGIKSVSMDNSTTSNIVTESEGTGNSGNLQPYIVTNYIIKAAQSAGIVANVVDNLNSSSSTDALSAKQGKALNDKIESPQKIKLYNGTCNVGDTITLSDNPLNYRIIFFRVGSKVTFPMCIQSPENPTVLRASQALSYSDGIELYAVAGTISGKQFTLGSTKQMVISASGNSIAETNEAVTEVWGIK